MQSYLLRSSNLLFSSIEDYFFNELNVHDFFKKHKKLYLTILNFRLKIRKKHFIVIIDAVNENDRLEYKEEIKAFVNFLEQYDRFRIIASCRSEYYKSRFEVEYMFDTMKNTLGFDKSYMNSDESIESWAFINHISIILTQRVYDLLRKKDVKITLHQLYRKLRQIKMIRNNLDKNDNYSLQGIPKKTRLLLEQLEINIS